MPKIIFISGACGSGKSTFADALARHLVRQDHKTVYVIHGDDFHSGFRKPEEKGDFFVNGQASDQVLWEDILRFNWDCIISTAQRALQDNLDVVIDYVIEDELPPCPGTRREEQGTFLLYRPDSGRGRNRKTNS